MKGINSSAQIAEMIAQSAAVGNHYHAELLRPAMAGVINVAVPKRDTRMPPLHRLGKRPLCVLVGDDDYAPPGPDTWACAAKLRSWAAFVVIHGTGAQSVHYAMAAAMTVQTRRLLFVETTSSAAQDWAGFIREREGLKFMGFLPEDGMHPVAFAGRDLH